VNLAGVLSKTGPGAMTITTASVGSGQTGGLDAQTALGVTTLNVLGTLNNAGPGSLTVGTTNLAGGGTFSKNGAGTTTLATVAVATGQSGTLDVQPGSTLTATTSNVSGALNRTGGGTLSASTVNLNNGTFNQNATGGTTVGTMNVAGGQTGGANAAAGDTLNITNLTSVAR